MFATSEALTDESIAFNLLFHHLISLLSSNCKNNMVWSHNIIRRRFRHHRFAISFFILVILTSSHFRFLFTAEGRKLAQTAESPKTAEMKEDKTVLWRSHVGSRPPRCERRCVSCTRCEAIQVPTNPQTTTTTTAGVQNSSPLSAAAAAAFRGDDDDSNYKPLSWKCKCGNFIYNP